MSLCSVFAFIHNWGAFLVFWKTVTQLREFKSTKNNSSMLRHSSSPLKSQNLLGHAFSYFDWDNQLLEGQ